jgi:hypothetical protein
MEDLPMSKRKSSLEESTERYTRHNDEMAIKLAGRSSPAFNRVNAAPEIELEDAVARAKKHWDEMEARMSRRSSVPPPKVRR